MRSSPRFRSTAAGGVQALRQELRPASSESRDNDRADAWHARHVVPASKWPTMNEGLDPRWPDRCHGRELVLGSRVEINPETPIADEWRIELVIQPIWKCHGLFAPSNPRHPPNVLVTKTFRPDVLGTPASCRTYSQIISDV